MLNKDFTKLHIQDTEVSTARSCSQLEIDNAYLSHQNELLNKELALSRYTINALKNIATQKDTALNETKLELEKALQHIQFLTFSLNQQRRYSNMGLSVDNELSDDMSEEDDSLLAVEDQRRSINIMSKLPLRQPTTTTTTTALFFDNNSVLDY